MSKKKSSIGRHAGAGGRQKKRAKNKENAAARDAAEAKAKRREAYAAKRAAAEAMADLSSPPATRQPVAVETPHTVSSEEAALRRQTTIYWYLSFLLRQVKVGRRRRSAGGTLALIRFHLAMSSTADVRWTRCRTRCCARGRRRRRVRRSCATSAASPPIATLKALPIVHKVWPITGARPGYQAWLTCDGDRARCGESEQRQYLATNDTLGKCADSLFALVKCNHVACILVAEAEAAATSGLQPASVFGPMMDAQRHREAVERAKAKNREAQVGAEESGARAGRRREQLDLLRH